MRTISFVARAAVVAALVSGGGCSSTDPSRGSGTADTSSQAPGKQPPAGEPVAMRVGKHNFIQLKLEVEDEPPVWYRRKTITIDSSKTIKLEGGNRWRRVNQLTDQEYATLLRLVDAVRFRLPRFQIIHQNNRSARGARLTALLGTPDNQVREFIVETFGSATIPEQMPEHRKLMSYVLGLEEPKRKTGTGY